MDHNNAVLTLLLTVLVIIFAIGHVIEAAELVGILPDRFLKWIARNRLEKTLRALKTLGVRVCWDEDTQTLTVIERLLERAHSSEAAYKLQTEQMLDEDS